MDRVLEPPKEAPIASKPRRSSTKEEARIFFPGEMDWECWSLSSNGKAALRASFSQEEINDKLKTSHDLAIPLQHLLVTSLWLATTDKSLMADMVSLQLESRGLSKASTESNFDFVVVKQHQDRSLLAVSVLPDNFPTELCHPRIANYRPASDYWTLPQNHALLWKELGRVVIAFTSGSDLIYAQSSFGNILHASLLFEIHCARLILENEGSISGLVGITVFGNFPREEIENLRQTLQLPLQQLERPVPTKPKAQRKLLPEAVQSSNRVRKQSRSKRRFLSIAFAIYILIAGAIVGQLAWLSWTKTSLEKDLRLQSAETDLLRNTSERWRAMELAILPETYPIEMLYRCTRLLPEEGLRFVTYDQDGTRILIAGESKNATSALQYIEALKKNPELDAYIWEMPPPKLLPNDSAQFQIEGKRRDASTQIQ